MSSQLKFTYGDTDKKLEGGEPQKYKEEKLEERPEERIVQCTNCHTKYSMPEDHLSQSQNKFHCYRCDTVFEVEVVTQIPSVSKKSEPKKVAPVREESSSGFGLYSGLSIKSSNFTQESTVKTRQVQEPVRDKKRKFEFNFSSVKGDSEQPEFVSDVEKFVFSLENSRGENLIRNNFNRFKKISSETFKLTKSFVTRKFSSSVDKTVDSFCRFSLFRTFLLLIGACVLFLGFLSFYLSSNTKASFIKADYKPAPPGVGLKDLEIKEMHLGNGETLNVLEGSVYNTTSEILIP